MSTFHVATTPDDPGPFHNRLATAASPYLRQHAHNPVDWRTWSPEVFREARERDLPVFLSIGYSACHWCHVMERESFEDVGIAVLLNTCFVPVKVDREEHPAIDALYMDALVRMTGEGGWPASLWLTADGLPFQAGTYYPPYPRYGLPSFRQALERIRDQWARNREPVLRAAAQTRSMLDEAVGGHDVGEGASPGRQPVEAGVEALLEAFDWSGAGWGGQARFPQPPRIALLLAAASEDHPEATKAARQLLDVIERSGLHDHIGGGFHRYTVDPDWEVPHFEKMLYDNALLARCFLHGSRILGRPRLATVAGSTLEYLLDVLRREDGAYGASQDAEDVEGNEGTTYTWTPSQLREALGPARADAVARAYKVEEVGNFEGGGSVLFREGDASVLASSRRKLLEARNRRPQPALDDKAVVAWNGMALAALADGARYLGDPRYRDAAEQLARRLLAARDPLHGPLPRTLHRQPPAGVLADQAEVGLGLLALYEATGAPWAALGAAELGALILRDFLVEGGLSQTPAGAQGLPLRRVSWDDGAEPSDAGSALLLLVRLHALGAPGVDAQDLARLLRQAAAAWGDQPARSPVALLALMGWEGPPWTAVVSGDPGPARDALVREARRSCRPWTLVAEHHPELEGFAVFEGKSGGGSPRVFICEGAACRLPLRDPEAVARALS